MRARRGMSMEKLLFLCGASGDPATGVRALEIGLLCAGVIALGRARVCVLESLDATIRDVAGM